MSYAPPSIGPAGLTIPNYLDILDDNLAQFLRIFGANQYIGTDSAIYQFLSIISLKQSDCCQALQLVYNQTSPSTAVGAGLDRLGKLNGIARLPYSYSTVIVTLTGTVGTVITNGVAQDVNGNQWLLVTPVTIPSGGTISVQAICSTPGAIVAEPGQVNIIASPVGGWASVTNVNVSISGAPIESDSQFRARQAISVSLPSITLLAGTIADLAATPGVTRYNVLENPTNAVDSYGNPPHSITAVVEGGTDLAVATTIYANRGIGCYTNGTTTVTVTDPDTGYTMPISFDRPTYVPIYVSLAIHLLPGGTTATLAAIQNAVVSYLNSLQIGQPVIYSELYGAALTARPNPDEPLFSIRSVTSGTAPAPAGTTDITVAFNAVSQGATPQVVITSV